MLRKDITFFSTMRFTSCMRCIIFMLVFDCHISSCLRNFAFNKIAYQSSTLNYNFNWTADKAVDGNTDGRNPDKSRTCSATALRMGHNTWEVDIGFTLIVNNVLIYERSDGNDQISGLYVLIGNHSNPNETKMALRKISPEIPIPYQHLFFSANTLARFVSVIRENKEIMVICEVQVYGECINGTYSEFCNRTCGQCLNGELCNKDTGACLHGCEPGWTGLLCDKGLRNLAKNKYAYQSSTENNSYFNWTADKAVDGNTDGSNPDNSRTCSKTALRTGSNTWEVDIGFMFIANHVVIYARSDEIDQLSGFEVIIGNHSNPWRANTALQRHYSRRFRYIFYADDTLARFVSVIRQNKETMTLCEVQVYGECIDGTYSEFCNRTCGKCANGEPCNKDTGECLRGCKPGWTGRLCDKGHRNFALNKSAHQSSTMHYNNFKWTADKSVDGNIDGSNPGTTMTCSKTDTHMDTHTWEVDIGFMLIVNHVVIYERSDGQDQLSGFEVYIGNHSNSWKSNKPLEKQALGNSRYQGLAHDSLARFVSVIRRDKETLTLCEVEVYGECLHGMYSELCNRTCGHCSNGETCNKDNGVCLGGCEPGWTGRLCNTECARGTYGRECTYTCGHCLNGNETCSALDGVCNMGCLEGWQGDTCITPSSAKVTPTLYRAHMTVIGGSVAGVCVGALVISIIIIAVMKRRRNTDTVDSEMKMIDTDVSRKKTFEHNAAKEIMSPSNSNDTSYCTPTTTASSDNNIYADPKMTKAAYEKLQDRGRIERPYYCMINGRETATASRDINLYAIAQKAKAEYEKLQDRGRIEGSYYRLNDTVTE